MKFLPLHTDALRSFGYTEQEARFLYLVATHSGYFTCQQFLQFIETKPGKRSVAFAQKVLDKNHASAKKYLRHGRVFHLFSRNLYEAIGRDNVRFRRVHSTEYIRTRLIALDFVLRNQDVTYLETEEQKLTFFCDRMGINKKILPHKKYSGAIKGEFSDRYFVDKFPMFYNPNPSVSSVVTFSFIDLGFESMDSFRTHLDAYLTLFTKLPQLRLYYIATRDTNFERAKKLFHGMFQRHWDPDAPFGLLQYFRTRRLWDEKQYSKLNDRDIEFLNQAQERFGDPGIQELYRKWRAAEITENAVRSESAKYRRPSQAAIIFVTVNGQAALFERHPHRPINIPVKSSGETAFQGDFTPASPRLGDKTKKEQACGRPGEENGTRLKHDLRRERPHRAAESRPGPLGLRGSLPPLAARKRSSCFGREVRSKLNVFVRRVVRQARSTA